MFTAIYEALCGVNDDPTYSEQIFPFVGLFSLIIALVLCIIFYVGLGRWKPVWDKLRHWIISIILLAAIADVLALTQAKGAIGSDSYDAYMIKFSLINALITVVYFIIFSLLLKRASIFAKRTPF